MHAFLKRVGLFHLQLHGAQDRRTSSLCGKLLYDMGGSCDVEERALASQCRPPRKGYLRPSNVVQEAYGERLELFHL